MPNWTDNFIQIRGAKEDLDKFINDGVKREGDSEEVKAQPYSFGSWIPRPETYDKYDTTNYPNGDRLRLGERVSPWDENSPIVTPQLIEEFKQATKEQMEKYGAVGWYDWNKKNYGCKWDEPFSIERVSDTEAQINVTTPWTAPDAFLLTISERYPNLEIEVDSHYEDGYNEWNIYNEGCANECDLGPFISELKEYMDKRVDEAETIDGEPVTDKNRPKYHKAVDWFITSGYWNHTSKESNWDSFEGDVNWILTDCIEDDSEEEA